jgi:hypothetical protein
MKLQLSSATSVARSRANNDLEFEKVMHKQCPIHPKSWHTLFKSVTICKSLNAPPLPQVGKRKDKEDDEGGEKSWAQDFQDPKNVFNVIFGRDGGFPSVGILPPRPPRDTLEVLSL